MIESAGFSLIADQEYSADEQNRSDEQNHPDESNRLGQQEDAVKQAFPELRSVTRLRENQEKQQKPFELEKIRHFSFPELDSLIEEIISLTSGLNPVELYTASNFASEKDQFIAHYTEHGWAENPQFQYDIPSNIDFSALKNQLHHLRQEILQLYKQAKRGQLQESISENLDSDLGQELQQIACKLATFKIIDDIATCNLALGIKEKDDQKSKKAIIQKYGDLDPSLLTIAEQVYQDQLRPQPENHNPTIIDASQQQWLSDRKFSAPEIAAAFSWALEKNGFLAKKPGEVGFLVKIDQASSIDVRDKNQDLQPMIIVPQDAVRTGKQLLALIGHEIEAHARQSMNGAELFRFGGGPLKIDNEIVYEGLAKRIDAKFAKQYFGQENAISKPFYTFAIDLALQGKTFSEVFSVLVEKIHQSKSNSESSDYSPTTIKSAWQKTYRVFRGSTDPENKAAYAMTKDKGYLEGDIMLAQLAQYENDELTEIAITSDLGLRLLSLIDLESGGKIPYPYQDAQRQYWDQVLLPLYLQETNSPATNPGQN